MVDIIVEPSRQATTVRRSVPECFLASVHHRCRFIGSLRALGEKDAALREARVLRIEKEDLKDQRVESDRKLDKVMTRARWG